MAKKKASHTHHLRKRRTREHIIADWSANYVERFILERGWVGERTYYDYGYDVTVTTFDRRGYAEAGDMKLQLKATGKIEKLALKNDDVYSFTITRADFNLWTESVLPVFFILYDSVREVAYWQYVQQYFQDHPPARKKSKHVQLHVPQQNVLDSTTMQMMRQKKIEILRQTRQVRHD